MANYTYTVTFNQYDLKIQRWRELQSTQKRICTQTKMLKELLRIYLIYNQVKTIAKINPENAEPDRYKRGMINLDLSKAIIDEPKIKEWCDDSKINHTGFLKELLNAAIELTYDDDETISPSYDIILGGFNNVYIQIQNSDRPTNTNNDLSDIKSSIIYNQEIDKNNSTPLALPIGEFNHTGKESISHDNKSASMPKLEATDTNNTSPIDINTLKTQGGANMFSSLAPPPNFKIKK